MKLILSNVPLLGVLLASRIIQTDTLSGRCLKDVPPVVPAVAEPVESPSKYVQGVPKVIQDGETSVIPIAPTSFSIHFTEYVPVRAVVERSTIVNLNPTCSTLAQFQPPPSVGLPSKAAPPQSSKLEFGT